MMLFDKPKNTGVTLKYYIESLLVQLSNFWPKTGNNVSEFTHTNWITLSYYSSPKHKESASYMLDPIPFTSVHNNLERGLAILTESFSPLRSILHNLSC